jgi:integrase/recombinase XerD
MGEIATVSTALQGNSEELISRYIGSLDIKPRSRETYSKATKHFIEWLNLNNITSPDRQDIIAYKAELLSSYTACTVSSYMTAVKSLYRWLEGEKISPNIANGIKGAKHQQGFRKDALSPEQANNVLATMGKETLEELRDFAIVNLLTRTALRTIEAQRANIEDIRSEGGATLLYIQGKGRDSKDAFVLLTENALRPIRKYLKARGETKESEPLFISLSDRNHGGRLSTRSISRIAKTSLVKAGYDSSRLTAHSLRHTAVTLSLLGGASLQYAQQLARHSNINTTLIYAHNIDRINKAAEKNIDSLLACY